MMNKLIISHTIKDLLFIIKNNFEYKNLEIVYIAIDGTPSKAKIIEQRKRRFMDRRYNNFHYLKNHKEQLHT